MKHQNIAAKHQIHHVSNGNYRKKNIEISSRIIEKLRQNIKYEIKNIGECEKLPDIVSVKLNDIEYRIGSTEHRIEVPNIEYRIKNTVYRIKDIDCSMKIPNIDRMKIENIVSKYRMNTL